MMETQSQLIAVKQLRNPLKTHDAPNHITRLQIRHATRHARLGLHAHRRINEQRQRRMVQKKIKQMTNGLIGSIRHIEKALLMRVERANEILVERVYFDVELGLIRQINA